MPRRSRRRPPAAGGRGARVGPAVLLACVVVGGVLALWQPVELRVVLDWGERITSHPATPVLVVAAMAILFTFAMPGSLCVWLVAPFQPPVVATAILVAGSVLGAFGAWLLAWRLGGGWSMGPRSERIMEALAARSDFVMLLALRVLPGFPHSVVNYAGGILRIALPRFLLAAALGLAVKWGVYTSAIRSGVGAAERGLWLDPAVLVPLVLLALLLFAGDLAHRRLRRR